MEEGLDGDSDEDSDSAPHVAQLLCDNTLVAFVAEGAAAGTSNEELLALIRDDKLCHRVCSDIIGAGYDLEALKDYYAQQRALTAAVAMGTQQEVYFCEDGYAGMPQHLLE